MKTILILTILNLLLSPIWAQYPSASVLTSDEYLQDPAQYLSELIQDNIETGILLDRCAFDESFFQYDGLQNVTTTSKNEFLSKYWSLWYSCNDTAALYTVDLLTRISKTYTDRNIFPIVFTDLDFNYIKQEAIDNNQFVENNGILKDINSNENSYSTSPFLSATVLREYIYGDNISFTIPRSLFFSNNSDDLQSLDIDFNNGLGYQECPFDEILEVSYNTSCEDIQVMVKANYIDATDGSSYSRFCHFTFYRKGSSLIPLPDTKSDVSLRTTTIKPNYVINGEHLHYYTTGVWRTEYKELPYNCGSLSFNSAQEHEGNIYYLVDHSQFLECGKKYTFRRPYLTDVEIEYCIYMNESNVSGKLRRPFIVCDGFDPGNEKNVFTNESDIDKRGMYEILDGVPSENEKDKERPKANLVAKLQERGYDIVFVNFMEGAGDIPENAKALRGFLNDIINGELRDNETEENILVGPSMGGLITRYALAEMEEKSEEHYVKQWVSFDSPHKGANVSIGFQWLVFYFSQINTPPESLIALNVATGAIQLFGAKSLFSSAAEMLNCPAAKQMVLQHYSQMGTESEAKSKYTETKKNEVGCHPDFYTFYNSMEALNNGAGYPCTPQRCAISNGGTSKLYESDGSATTMLKMTNWTKANSYGGHNADGCYKIFKGYRQDKILDFDKNENDYSLYTANQIGYENSPGGGYAMNGIVNDNDGNKNEIPSGNQYDYFTFMPTPTTFGIEITRDNVYKTWEAFEANNDTPFDYIKGMTENEEHVQITEKTANDIVLGDILQPTFLDLVKPYNRAGENNTQTVSGAVTYNAENTVTFAGSGNKFIIANGAEASAKAGNSISFLPGFSVKNGAQFKASIEDVGYLTPTTRSSSTQQKASPIDYTKPLKYDGKVFDYSNSINQDLSPEEITPLELLLYPNPASSEIYLLINTAFSISDITEINYNLINSFGQSIQSGILVDHQNLIKIHNYPPGLYIVTLSNGQELVSQQFIKE